MIGPGTLGIAQAGLRSGFLGERPVSGRTNRLVATDQANEKSLVSQGLTNREVGERLFISTLGFLPPGNQACVLLAPTAPLGGRATYFTSHRLLSLLRNS
jgi:hypothetical protein